MLLVAALRPKPHKDANKEQRVHMTAVQTLKDIHTYKKAMCKRREYGRESKEKYSAKHTTHLK